MKRSTRKGFTLVEVLIVVVIVGILALVAVPVMSGMADDAQRTEGETLATSTMTKLKANALVNSAGTIQNVSELTLASIPAHEQVANDWTVTNVSPSSNDITVEVTNSVTSEVVTLEWTVATNSTVWQ